MLHYLLHAIEQDLIFVALFIAYYGTAIDSHLCCCYSLDLCFYEKRKENFANTEKMRERKDIEIFWLIELNWFVHESGLYTPFPNSGPKPS